MYRYEPRENDAVNGPDVMRAGSIKMDWSEDRLPK